MNKASTVRLSLRKLLLATMAVGPLAVLPAPVWAALPAAKPFTNTNGTATWGVSGVSGAGSALIETSDRAVLVWNPGAFNIAEGETFNFAVPTGGAVLNKVGYTTTGALAGATDNAIIDGSLNSTGGRVFVLANGDILIGGKATINTAGGLVLSTLQETSDFSFTTGGNLSLSGSSRGAITIGNATNSPSITGGLQAHAGAITLHRASVTGDLVLNQVTAGSGLALAQSAAVSVTGNLSVTTNSGAITQTNAITVGIGTAGEQTATFSTGTTGNDVITLDQAANDFEVVSINAPTATGDVTLVEANIITLGNSTIGGDLVVTATGTSGSTAIATNDTLTIGGAASFVSTTSNSGVSIAHNSTIAGSLAGSVANSSFTVNATGPITVGTVGAVVGITGTAGNRTSVSVRANDGALAINSPITTTGGPNTATPPVNQGGNVTLTGTSITQSAAGDISVSTTTHGLVSYNATAGSVILGDVTAQRLSVTANSGSISQAGTTAITTQGATTTSTFNATNNGSITLNNANQIQAGQVVQLSGGSIGLTNGQALTIGTINASGNVNLQLAANALTLGSGTGTSGQDIKIDGTLTAVSGAVTTNNYTNINIFGGINLTTGGADVTLTSAAFTIPSNVQLGRVDINAGAGAVRVVETTTLNLGTITAGSLNAQSVQGGIVDSGTLNITGLTTLIAPTTQGIVLDGSGHSLASLAVQGGMDNSIVVGGAGTILGNTLTATTTGNLTLTSSSGAPITLGADASNVTVGNLTVTSGGTVAVNGIVNVTGNLSLSAADTSVNAVTDDADGSLVVSGTTSIGSTGDIVLNNGLSNFVGAVTLNNGRDVTLYDANDLTVNGNATGAVSVRAGQGTVANTWALTLGNLNVGSLDARAASTLAGSSGNSGSITQQAGTSIHSERLADFRTTNAAISVNRTGNSFGRVEARAGSGAINLTEDGFMRVGVISTTGSARLESRFGSIIEDNEGNNDTTINVEGTTTLIAQAGSVQLGGTTRATTSGGETSGNLTTVVVTAPTGSVSLRSTGDTNLTLGNITAMSLNATSTGRAITQTSSGSLKIFGSSNFTAARDITLNSEANNFGRVSLAITETATDTTARNISIVEAGTLNLGSVSMGFLGTGVVNAAARTGTFTARSVNGDIIDTGLGGVKIGGLVAGPGVANAGAILSGTGVATLSAANGNIVLDDATTDFHTTSGVVFNAKNVTLEPLGQATLVLGANNTTSTADNLTATTSIGSIANAGNLNISGNATFQAGNGNITVSQPGNRFGVIKFSGNQVAISQVNDMNIATGSSAIGLAQLASTGSYVTITNVGDGVVSFGNSVSISAGSSITLPKLIQAVGTLSVNAPGTKDLSALSISGDLGGKSPVNLGTGTYLPPQP